MNRVSSVNQPQNDRKLVVFCKRPARIELFRDEIFGSPQPGPAPTSRQIPSVQLELIAPVRAGEQLFVDYGSSYAYSKHGFARFTGGGVLDDINPFHKTTIADAIDRQKAINDHPYSIRRLL